ncbi:hypothetical protein SporoP17a_15460 [Sporosarcina ureae]|nr:hypothetical protein SporoP17a_15460 [Sporosarcina ureae]
MRRNGKQQFVCDDLALFLNTYFMITALRCVERKMADSGGIDALLDTSQDAFLQSRRPKPGLSKSVPSGAQSNILYTV